MRQRAGKQRHRPAEHDEGHEDADGEKGDELDDRLGRDRQHQSVLMLGGVDVPGAKQDRKRGHQQRDEERDVADERLRQRHSRRSVGENGADRRRHRFELQRDVGDHADDRDQRHGRRHGLALAVARGDEVGDRGDVLPLGETDDADHERIGEADHQHRPDIDGEEIEAGSRRHPDRAEERPGGAIDRQRQRIDQEPGAAAAHEFVPAIAIARDQEQKADIRERDDDDDPALQHGASCLGSAALCGAEAPDFTQIPALWKTVLSSHSSPPGNAVTASTERLSIGFDGAAGSGHVADRCRPPPQRCAR